MATRAEKTKSNSDSSATGAGNKAGLLYDEIRAEGIIGGLKKTVRTHLTGGTKDTGSGDIRDPDFFDDADKSSLSADREARMDSNGNVVSEDVRNGMTGDPGLRDSTRGPDFFDDADVSNYSFDKEIRMKDGEIVQEDENKGLIGDSGSNDQTRSPNFFDDADISNYDADTVAFDDGPVFDNTGLDTEIDDSYLDMSSKIIELEYLSENIEDISSDYMSEGKLAGMASIALEDGTSSIWKDRWDNIMGYDVDKGKAVKVADKESEMAKNYDKVQEKVIRIRDQKSEYSSMKDEMVEDTLKELSISNSSQDPISSIHTAFYNSGLGEKLYDSLETDIEDWLKNYPA